MNDTTPVAEDRPILEPLHRYLQHRQPACQTGCICGLNAAVDELEDRANRAEQALAEARKEVLDKIGVINTLLASSGESVKALAEARAQVELLTAALQTELDAAEQEIVRLCQAMPPDRIDYYLAAAPNVLRLRLALVAASTPAGATEPRAPDGYDATAPTVEFPDAASAIAWLQTDEDEPAPDEGARGGEAI